MSGSDYDVSSIQVLEGVEAVRKRPGMYVGNNGPIGMVHLAFELVSNALAEHVEGHARTLSVQTGPAGLTVSDDGRGIPPGAFVGFSQISGPFHPTVHLAGTGLGLGVVSGLSSVMVVTSDRERRYQQVFVQGRPVTNVLEVGSALGQGTTVHVVPDVAIFKDARLPVPILRKRLEELAVLNPGLAVTLDGALVPSHGGLLGYARWLAGQNVRQELSASGTFDGVKIEIAVVWGEGEAITHAWANQLDSDGAHLSGLNRGLRGTDERGRVALVSVTLPEAIFDGRLGRTLRGDSVRDIVRDVVTMARRGELD